MFFFLFSSHSCEEVEDNTEIVGNATNGGHCYSKWRKGFHPEGGLLYKSDGGDRRKFLKEPLLRYQNLILWVWLEFNFTSKRYQFYDKTSSFHTFSRLNILKGTGITLTVVILDFNTLSGTKPQI